MKTRLFLIFFVASFATAVHGQWTNFYMNHFRSMNSIYVIDYFNVCGVGGNLFNDSLETTLTSWDAGFNFNEFGHISPWLRSVVFTTPLKGISVGFTDKVMLTTDGGNTWTYANTPGPVHLRDYNGVFFTDSLHGIAVGGDQYFDTARTIIKTVDGGNNWTIVKDTANWWLNSVYFTSATNGIAVGDKGSILKTIDGGNTWQVRAVTGPAGTRNYKSVYFSSASNGIIVGGNLTNDSVQTILRTTDGGDTWSIVRDSIAPCLNGVQFYDHVHGYAVGNTGTVLETSDGGGTWFVVNIPGNNPINNFNTVFFLNQNYGYISGVYGITFRYDATTGNGPTATTLQATNVFANSAQMNALVNPNHLGTDIRFEYGTTIAYGTEVNGNPSNASGTSDVNVSYLLSGLTQGITYHYRVKAMNALDTVYGNDITFFTANGPNVTTLPASNITMNSALLNATAIANNNPTAVKFEWGMTMSYGNEASATPDSVFGTANNQETYQLNGLLPNMIYHYRVKAICSLGTVFGNDISFQTYFTSPAVTTQTATEITQTSAKLNATVNPHHLATTIKFDYGLTNSYGSVINGNPATSSDSVNLNVYANLSGLTSNTLYHFRINAITANDTVYGNDMIFFTGQPEIPNFDFEIWDTPSIDFPDGWTKALGLISKYSPACSGNYAIKIQNTPSGGVGAVTLGIIGNSIYGGVPFNARPDSLAGCFMYNIDVNDTSWVGLLFKKDGNPISMNIYNIVGNSGGNFINLKFPIHYQSIDTPDTLIMLMSSTNFSQKVHSPNSWIIVDNIHFIGTSLNVPNNDFEQWHTEYGLDLDNWNYSGKGAFPIDTSLTSGVIRTTDAEHNTYAAKLKTVFWGGSFTAGSLHSGNDVTDKIPVSARHQNLTGYYKFFPQNNDTMNISIKMFMSGAAIGGGTLLQENTVNSYTPFIVDISYNTSGIPDSAIIMISAFNKFPPQGNSILYADYLNFDGFLAGVKETPLTDAGNIDFNVYPNPFSGKATVTFSINHDDHVVVSLYDLSGKKVATVADGNYETGGYKIDISGSGLRKGFYICTINTQNSVNSKKLVVY